MNVRRGLLVIGLGLAMLVSVLALLRPPEMARARMGQQPAAHDSGAGGSDQRSRLGRHGGQCQSRMDRVKEQHHDDHRSHRLAFIWQRRHDTTQHHAVWHDSDQRLFPSSNEPPI